MKQTSPTEYLMHTAQESTAAKQRFLEEFGAAVVQGAQALGECVKNGGKILIFGNGGSAADAQHMAAELVGRMLMERRALAAIALTTDTSNLTAIANDYAYEQIFSRQLEALAKPGDVAIAISTSGKSPNVLRGVETAKRLGCRVISLTGGSGGALHGMADIGLNVSLGHNSSRIQETHIFIVHSLVDLMDRFFLDQ